MNCLLPFSFETIFVCFNKIFVIHIQIKKIWYNIHVGNEQCEKSRRQIFVMLACKKICLRLFS